MSGAENLFLDTNVLVYCYDQNEPIKGPQAQALLKDIFAAGVPFVSTQVISEFYWTVTRKIALPLSPAAALAEVQYLAGLSSVVPVTWATLGRAFMAVTSHGLALWDAQILAPALLSGASIILTEDFQHRQTLDGATFLNPFAADFVIRDILSP